MTPRAPALPASQQGAAALIVALALLLAMAVMAAFLNRGLLFEQRTSVNQYHATRTFEAAEAGIEWAIGLLNAGGNVGADCVLGTGAASFRQTYLQARPSANGIGLRPVADAHPGCSIDGDALRCSCPAPGATPRLVADRPSFTLTFNEVQGDPAAIEVVSNGCIGAAGPCLPDAAAPAQGHATVRVVLKLLPHIRTLPAAAVTAGGSVVICGAFDMANDDADTNGLLVHAGSQVLIGSSFRGGSPRPPQAASSPCAGSSRQVLATLPGTPPALAIVTDDDSLHTLAAAPDAMFAAFFGSTPSRFGEHHAACRISGSNAAANASQLLARYADTALKCRSFMVQGPLELSGNTIGSANEPVLIASSSRVSFAGTPEVWGLIYADTADWSDFGTGRAQLHGAVIARGDLRHVGDGSVDYDPEVLLRLRNQGGRLVRVPGSWRDF